MKAGLPVMAKLRRPAFKPPPVNPARCSPIGNIRAGPHQLPQQACAIVLNHKNDRPLVDAKMPFGYPSIGVAGSVRDR